MANFATDTALTGSVGRYKARLSPHWEVWGPFGGYVAAIALRAMGMETRLTRPASISCQFLSVARFEEVDVEVTSLRKGKRSEALCVRVTQQGLPILSATGWVVESGMHGLEHDQAVMPAVVGPELLASYADRAPNYAEWYPVWHGGIDGRPTQWSENPGPGEALWRTWMRLSETPALDDPFLDAARSLMWMDLMMWNAALVPHLPWPISHLAPNLDVTAIFHAGAADEEWLLCDSAAPVGRDGLVGCSGRVWSPSGRLIASGNASLFCRPNPLVAGG